MALEPGAIEVLNQYAQFSSMIGDINNSVRLLKTALGMARTRDDVQDLQQVSEHWGDSIVWDNVLFLFYLCLSLCAVAAGERGAAQGHRDSQNRKSLSSVQYIYVRTD